MPVARRKVGDIPFSDADGPAVYPLESGQAPEQRRLSAAGGPEQDHELAVTDEKVHILERGRLPEDLADGLERDTRHQLTYPVPTD